MIEIGKTQKLNIARETENGLYLTDGSEEVLLPQRYIPFGFQLGDEMEVFVYTDSMDRPVAVTDKPLAEVGQMAVLQVKEIAHVGAFLDIGLEKDLMVPFREQQHKMEEGRAYMVKVLLDHRTQRMIGTSKVEEFLAKDHEGLEEGQMVDIYIWKQTEMGFKVIVNQQYQGLVYANEVFEKISHGDQKKAYVKKLREDGKIDIALQRQGYVAAQDMSVTVLKKIQENNGVLDLGDKSSPGEIKAVLGMSKKNFKKILGGLYKAGEIEIYDYEVRIKVEG